ncbi:MAG: hypothetical protein ACP5SG_06225 [Dissulfurimicrobium sp.]|uniref:hypothetical protein n=1 Tax=Dissulfurimicrobium TaxID=1769732 RepID=UPI001EDAEE77|nr:hypothetical protein [Dissulfurimicrobium hydrothermale]UKL14551.1 hypothetical protein LGS26_04810 [Dissulfurimicrobium hydrothermale]
MSALTLLVQKINLYLKDSPRDNTQTKDTEAFNFSEAFWFTTTFLLFLALGPFSAIAVVFGVLSLAGKGDEGNVPCEDCN